MKERPILFSSEMVRAILDGRKTQTRRIIKESFNGCLTNGGQHPCPNDPVVIYPDEEIEFNGEKIKCDYQQVRAIFHCSTLDSEAKCPFGKKGTILWGREMLYQSGELGLNYVADNEDIHEELIPETHKPYRNYAHCNIPSIHMPKWASRIWLKVEDIKVEALQEISEEDAKAEGVETILNSFKNYQGPEWNLTAKESYQTLWDSINGEGSFNIDPWVWVVKFKVLSTTGRPINLN